MRRVITFLVAAGLTCAIAYPAAAAPPSSDAKTDAAAAATWLARQVNSSGFIPQASDGSTPNLSVSAQAVTAMAAAGVGKNQVDALLTYLGAHVNDFVVNSGADDPGALAYLILAVRAAGEDATSFGSPPTNLVTRLVATQQPNGLFGSADPSFDGAFRQGLSLLALHAAGESNAAGVTWLEGQAMRERLVDVVPREHGDAVRGGRSDDLRGTRHELDRARDSRLACPGRVERHRERAVGACRRS